MNSKAQLNLFKGISFIATALLVVTFYFYKQSEPTYFLDPEGNKIRVTQEMVSELFSFNEVINVSDPDLIQKWEEQNVNIDSVRTGRVISQRDAINQHTSFQTWNRNRFNFVKEITPSGFAFGKYRIRNMLNAIDSTNRVLNRQGNRDSLIYGVRAYLTFSNINGRRRDRHLDLMFVPIMKNGKTYVDISGDDKIAAAKALGDGGLIVNTSSPCPNMCK